MWCGDLLCVACTDSVKSANPSGNVRFSSISFDRASTPDKLVVSEYSTSSDRKLLRFNLGFMTRLPANNSAVDGWLEGIVSPHVASAIPWP